MTWLSTLPREYLVYGSCTAISIASEMAMPRLPGESGSSFKHLPSCCGHCAWRRDHPGVVGIHQQLAAGFLVIADLYHEYKQLKSEVVAGKAHCAAPLAGTRLCGDPPDAFHLVVVCLRDGSIGLM